MNKLRKFLCVTLLLLMVFAVCGCQDDAVDADPKLYWCMDKEVPTANADGSYTLDFVCDGQPVSYRCTDAALAEKICLQDVMGLTLDGDTITAMTYMHDMPQTLLAWDYCVKSMGGGKVKVNSESAMNGGEVMFSMTEQTKVYLVSPLTDNPGEETELMKYDGVTVITNDDDEAEIVFVSERSYKPDTEKTYCQHCEEDVLWSAWVGKDTLPAGAGHYRLENDVMLSSRFGVGGGGKLCLDLNGKRIEQTASGVRIYHVTGATELTIMDSVGTGVIRTSAAPADGSNRATSGMAVGIYNNEAILNLYAGTLDGSGNPAQWAGVVELNKGTFNMYGGTILGADPWSTGSGAVCVEGTFNMYDGKIVGGRMATGPSYSMNPKGGAALYVTGFFNMYGGTLEGGDNDYVGGSVYVRGGTLNLSGGTITGAKSAVAGSGIYMFGGKLTLSGNIQITGNEGDNVCFGTGAKLEIGELDGAQVGISMDTPGVLGEFTGDTLPEGIYSDDSNHKLVIRDGELILE